MWAAITSLIQMAREAWHPLQYFVTWLTRMVLVWQSLVTTVREERRCVMVSVGEVRVATHVTFITLERVFLSLQVWPESPHIVNSLSNTSVMVRACDYTVATHTDGGCHVILLRWHTGVEHHLAVVSAHAGWPTHAQNPVLVVTVRRMTVYGGKTAVSWLKRQSFQWNSSGLVMLGTATIKVTILLENWSAMAQYKEQLLTLTHKKHYDSNKNKHNVVWY